MAAEDDSLHRAVFSKDIRNVKTVLSGMPALDWNVIDPLNHPINAKDARGNTALHLAVWQGSNDIASLLIKHGASAQVKNTERWSPLQEAVSTGNSEIVRALLKEMGQRLHKQFKARVPRLLAELERVPDFYVELQWKFSSWVPFVTRFCPSDVCKIWKSGSTFRVDMSLVGREGANWLQGDVSYIFKGSRADKPGELIMLNHDKATKAAVFTGKGNTSDAFLDRETERLMRSPLHQADVAVEEIQFAPRTSWFSGGEKREEIDGYPCQVYDIKNLELNVMDRTEHLPTKGKAADEAPAEVPPYVPTTVTAEEYFGSTAPLLMGRERRSKTSKKTFKGSVWLTDQYPLNIAGIVPLIEVMAPATEQFARIKTFIDANLPATGFPVKIELPLYGVLTGSAHFVNYRACEHDPALFVIPDDYKVVTFRLRPG